MRLLLLALLFLGLRTNFAQEQGEKAIYLPLSYPGDGCNNYHVDHSVSATLDTDLHIFKQRFADPTDDPETLFFHLFGQRYWKLEEVSSDARKLLGIHYTGYHKVYRVYFTYGGSVTLQVCVFQHQIGVQVTILDSYGGHFHQEDLTGSTITITFNPESWYGNRMMVSAGFSLGPNHQDERHAVDVLWTYVNSFIQHIQSVFGAYPCDVEFRTATGYCNNVANHDWGSINTPMRRLSYSDPDPRYLAENSDGIPVDHSRPSARKVSNYLLNQYQDVESKAGVNMLWVSFGQFLDHDVTLNSAYGPQHPLHVPYHIPVRADDHYFDQNANDANCKNTVDYNGNYDETVDTGAAPEEGAPVCEYKSIAFFRSEKYLYKGDPIKPFIQYNTQTAYADLSQVYGNTAAKIKHLREFKHGMLKVSPDNLLPYNGKHGVGISLAVEAEDEETAGVAGDVRCNEQPYLTMLHVMWVREHNKIAYELHELFPDWGDERLYQEARKVAIAEYQAILYKQWLPFLIGFEALGPYKGYQQCVDPTISSFFATCAFRFGHTMVTRELKACDYHLHDLRTYKLEETLFADDVWTQDEVNFDTLFLGAHKLPAEESDAQIQNALRNHLFSDFKEGTSPGFDLAAANIQRCRDHSCPSWTSARKNFKLELPSSWRDLKQFLDNPRDVYRIIRLYGYRNLYNLDPFPLGLMEKKFPGALVGSLFQRAIADQFWRLREGDRFYYENIDINCDVKRKYPRILDILEGKVSLKDIFLRTFDKKDYGPTRQLVEETLPYNPFLSPENKLCGPPLPILKPTVDYYDKGELQCPYGYDRVQRYFWNAHYGKAELIYICDVDSAVVNGLKGFATEREAQYCGHLLGANTQGGYDAY
ncbi:hypothetical protein BSKO_09810 [Bryopsis sp. KO-2023]|nr:hypothetical protein BSKO_09810 [Bryopsis sp. KO-2023]